MDDISISERRVTSLEQTVHKEIPQSTTGKAEETISTVDDAISEAEPQKTYYSKQSVWLMVLFSGLAIGSDG